MPKYRGLPPYFIGREQNFCSRIKKKKKYKQIRIIHYDLDDGWGKDINYKIIEKDGETFLKYISPKKIKRFQIKKVSKESPFNILKNLNLN